MIGHTKTIPPLSPDATDDEIIEWTETYDLGTRLDSGISEVVAIHPGRTDEHHTAQLTLRVPFSMKAAIQSLARQRTTSAASLARTWLAERLQQELDAQD